jgi:hypothetical protein
MQGEREKIRGRGVDKKKDNIPVGTGVLAPHLFKKNLTYIQPCMYNYINNQKRLRRRK